jgi:hypothetical protein
MTEQSKTTESIQQLISSVDDENASKILSAIALLAERLDAIGVAQGELQRAFEVSQRGPTHGSPRSVPATESVERGSEAGPPAAVEIQPPLFVAEISEYESGVLFEDQVGFDLSLHYNDPKSWEWYRIWGFHDAGHVLHVLLEACARSECAADAEAFTYRRDINSATVYATQREPLERLLSRFLHLSDSDEGTLQLIQQMNLSLNE